MLILVATNALKGYKIAAEQKKKFNKNQEEKNMPLRSYLFCEEILGEKIGPPKCAAVFPSSLGSEIWSMSKREMEKVGLIIFRGSNSFVQNTNGGEGL